MDLGNPWYGFAYRVRRGESSREDLIETLRSGWPMPHKIQPFIADLLDPLEKKRTFKKRGPKSRLDSVWQKWAMASMLLHTEEYLTTQNHESLDCIAHPGDSEAREYLATQAKALKQNGGSPREAAKEYVADFFSTQVRSLEYWLSPDRERDFWR